MSNKTIEERHLDVAEQHIIIAEELIAQQEERIKHLTSIGCDTISSERVLTVFNTTLNAMYAHRGEILAALNK
jgi:hypothetical protein